MSFRQFGGLNYSARQNVVSSNYNTSNNLLVTQNVGQPKSYINFLSDISGNIIIYGNVDISGNLHVTQNIDVSKNLHVTQNLDVDENVNIKKNLDVDKNVNIKKNLDVDENVNIKKNLDVSGNVIIKQNLDVDENVNIKKNLDVDENVNIKKNLDVSGNVIIKQNLDVDENVNIKQNLDVDENVNIKKNLDVSGNVIIKQNLDVDENVNIKQNLDVSGNVNIIGDLSANYMYLTSGTNYSTSENAVMPKSYIDLVSTGINPVGEVKAISTIKNGIQTTNNIFPVPISIDVSSNFVIDNVILSPGDAVLLFDQSNNGTNSLASVDNGVYYYTDVGSGNYQFTRNSNPYSSSNILPIGSDAKGAFISVLEGDLYTRTGWLQTNTNSVTDLAIVGTDQLFFSEFYNLNFIPAQGLNTSTIVNTTYLNIDSSLNFINFIDSDSSAYTKPGGALASGTLALGTNTTNKIVIGPTGTNVPIQAQSLIQAQQGITGATGSFNNLNSSSNTYLATNNGTKVGIGTSNPDYTLDVSGNANFSGPVIIQTNFDVSSNPSLSVEDSSSNNKMYFLPNLSDGNYNPASKSGYQAIVATETLELTSWSAKNSAVIIGPTSVSMGAGGTSSTPTTSVTCDGSNCIITGQIVSSSGITGPTGFFNYGSFNNLNSSSNTFLATTSGQSVSIGSTTANTSGYALDVNGNINTNGVITGPTGSFSVGMYAPNISGSTGSFTNLNSSSNTYLATNTGTKVGIGTTSPNYTLDVNGNLRTTNNTFLATTSGQSVSIGTITANSNGYALDVNGNINTNGVITGLTGSFSVGMYAQNISGSTGSFSVGMYAPNISGSTGSFNYLNSSNNTFLATNTETKVGIGTTSPSYALDVSGNLRTTNNTYLATTSGQSVSIGTTNANSSGYALDVSGNINTNGVITGTTGSFSVGMYAPNISGSIGSFNYLNSSNNTFLATNTGTNVGIGTTSPSYTLDVSGNINTNGVIKGTTGSFNYGSFNNLNSSNNTFLATTPGQSVSIGTTTANSNGYALDVSGDFNFTGNILQGGVRFSGSQWDYETGNENIFYSLGNVGIGTSNPSYTLDVNGNINTNGVITGATGSFNYLNSSNNTFLATNTGTKVGIGTSNPDYTLDVSGNANFSGPVLIQTNYGYSSNPSLSVVDSSSNNKIMYFLPNLNDLNYNPASKSGYQAIVAYGSYNNQTLELTSWSATNSAVIIGPTSVSMGAGGNSSTPTTSVTCDGSNCIITGQIVSSSGITGPTGFFNYGSFNNLNSSSNTYLATANGKVGIGTTSPSCTLDVNGQVSAATFNSTSDYRIKENIEILNETHNVDNLRPVTYFNKKTEKQDIGLVAHELQVHFPYLVNGEKDGEELQHINYSGLIPILIKEIQELKKEIKLLHLLTFQTPIKFI